MPRTRFDAQARAKVDPVWELIYSRAASQGVSCTELAAMSKRWERTSMYMKMREKSVRSWPMDVVLNICSGLRIPIDELREKLRYY